MRITIDVRKLHDSGVGTYIRNLVPLVIQELPAFHFSLLGNSTDLQKLGWHQLPNTQIIDYQVRPYSIAEQISTRTKIPKDTDLLWVPFINIPLAYQGKLLVTVCDVNFLALPQYLDLKQRVYAKLMFKAIRRKAAHILSISQFSKDELLRLVPNNKENVTVTLLGAPQEYLSLIPNEPSPYPHPFFLFVGNVKPHKNLRRLIQAFRQIMSQVLQHLIIIGKKEGFIIGEDNILDELSGIEDRIIFTGYVDGHTIRQYYAHATALVFPSLYEGFGFPALEAMSSSCPALVSNLTSFPEVCGDAALYCDPYSVSDIADKMMRLATDLDLRQNLIAFGHRRAAQLTWDNCVTTTIRVIQESLHVQA